MNLSGRIISVNLARPTTLPWNGGEVTTGIYKEPHSGPVMARTLGLDGDMQANHEVHGGPRKAIYVYPAEHYAFWRGELGEIPLPWGVFGENLTVEGLDEDSVDVGDRFQAGDAEFEVTTPREPCFKLGLKFEALGIAHMAMIKKFWKSERSGFYLAVLKEGMVQAGDEMKLVYADPRQHSIHAAFVESN
jgi:MOSC domain-containing protein YiiM